MKDIVEVLRELKIEYRSHGEDGKVCAGWVGVRCPWCRSESFKLGIPANGRCSSCWTCGTHNIASTLVKLSGLPYSTIRPLIDGLSAPYLDELHTFGNVLKLPRGIVELQGTHRRYLQKRGFDPNEISRIWKVQGIGATGERHAWSLFVPIHKYGRVVSWLTRKIGNVPSPRRYCLAPPNEEALPAKRTCYGMDFVRNACIVVEGVTDAWRIGPGAVATFGVGYSQVQLAEISKIPVRAICFDSELTAQARARQLARSLEVWPGQTFVVALDADDPGSANKKEIAELRSTFLGE